MSFPGQSYWVDNERSRQEEFRNIEIQASNAATGLRNLDFIMGWDKYVHKLATFDSA